MVKQLVMGIDVGSTGVKAALFDPVADRTMAEPIATATVPYVAHQPTAGISEHAGELLMGASVQAMRELHAAMVAAGRPVSLAGIAVCAMMSGAIPVAADGTALAPYTTTLDRRADAWLLAAMRAHGERIFHYTGSTQPVMAAKMAWLQDALGTGFDRVAKVLPAGAFVAGRLANLPAHASVIDPTYLWMTGLADVRQDAWADELAELLAVDMTLLPRIRQSTEVIGGLDPVIAAETGWVAGTPIVAGCGDQLAGYLGAGLNKPGMACDVAGTYAVFAVTTDCFVPAQRPRLDCVRAAIPGLWLTQSLVAGGGLNAGWFCASVIEGRGIDEGGRDAVLSAALSQAAAQLPPGADGVCFVPHLGGQALPLVPDLRGAWLGLNWSHRREHLFRAVLESIAFEHGLSLQERRATPGFVAPQDVITYGGGAANDLWQQIKADVLGVPYRRLAIADPAARGCALLAAAAVGLVDDLADAAAAVHCQPDVTHPDARAHRDYAALVARYDTIVTALGELE